LGSGWIGTTPIIPILMKISAVYGTFLKSVIPMIELNIGIALLFLISGFLGKLMIERRR